MAVQIMPAGRMRTDITVTVDDRAQLERLVADRNTPTTAVWRALGSCWPTHAATVRAIARATAKSKPSVWRWALLRGWR